MPTCWIFAGPNGAGKTTYALQYMPNILKCHRFVNADLIAAGLSPLVPQKQLISASKLFLAEVNDCVKKKQDFAFETTLSGKGHLKLVHRLKAEGWHVEMIYLALPSMEMSKKRVAERVKHGGHDIPVKDIERRFPRSLYNLLELFAPAVDKCLCLMSHEKKPILVFEQAGESRVISNEDYYQQLVKSAKK